MPVASSAYCLGLPWTLAASAHVSLTKPSLAEVLSQTEWLQSTVDGVVQHVGPRCGRDDELFFKLESISNLF